MLPTYQKIVLKNYTFKFLDKEETGGLVTYSASDNDTTKDTMDTTKNEVYIRVNTSYRKRLEEDLKSFQLDGDIPLRNPECDDQALLELLSDMPNKYSLRAYESEDEFDAFKINVCQKEVSFVDDINVLYGTEEKSDYYQRTIDQDFAHKIYLEWKPMTNDGLFSDDSKWGLTEDEEKDEEIQNKKEDSAKEDAIDNNSQTANYEADTNDTTPSLDHECDDSETETASENGQNTRKCSDEDKIGEDDDTLINDNDDQSAEIVQVKANADDDTLNDVQSEMLQNSVSKQEQNSDELRAHEAEHNDHSYCQSSAHETSTADEINNEKGEEDHDPTCNESDHEDKAHLVDRAATANNNTGVSSNEQNTDETLVQSAKTGKEQNTDNIPANITDDVSDKATSENNDTQLEKVSDDDKRGKSERIHLVIEQLGMSTETEATIENFELSATAISQSLGSLEEEELSFHSVDDETILSTLYSGTNDNMSEQNDGKLQFINHLQTLTYSYIICSIFNIHVHSLWIQMISTFTLVHQ